MVEVSGRGHVHIFASSLSPPKHHFSSSPNMATPLPDTFPDLPAHFDGGVWPPNVVQAYGILQGSYQYALEALNAGDNDGHRLELHSEKIQTRMLPILEAMEVEVLNPEWLKASAEALSGLVVQLEVSASTIEKM